MLWVEVTSPTGSGLTYSMNNQAFQESSIFEYLTPGTYEVVVQNEWGCISGPTEITVQFEAAITLSKQASPQIYNKPGDEISYQIEVENTGEVELCEVIITDPMTGLEETVPVMLPGEVVILTARYTITPGDISNGIVTNTAYVEARVPGFGVLTSDMSSVAIYQSSGLVLDKQTDTDQYSQAGDQINYTLTVRNEGDVDLTNVTLIDSLLDLDIEIGLLTAGFSQTIESVYQISHSDILRGHVTNQATAIGTDIFGNQLVSQDSVRVTYTGLSLLILANDDYDTTNYQTPIQLFILSNDEYWPEEVTIELTTDASHGLTGLNTDQTLTYTPLNEFYGEDSLTYRIYLSQYPGLSDTAKVYIYVKDVEDLGILPDRGVSNNNDGINDNWLIKNIENYPENKVILFNRWGDEVNRFTGYDNKQVVWDGTNNRGQKLPDGVYFYVIEYNEGQTISGWVMIKSSL